MNYSRIIQTYIRGNEYDYHVEFDNGESTFLSFKGAQDESTVVTAAETLCQINNIYSINKNLPMIYLDFLEYFDLLKHIIIFIKNKPNLTLTQWNNYLSTFTWFEVAIIKAFIFMFAVKLKTLLFINFNDQQETIILQRIRDWIVETPLKKIYKLLINDLFINGALGK